MPKVSVSYGHISKYCKWELFCKLIGKDKYILIDGLVRDEDYVFISIEMAYDIGVLPYEENLVDVRNDTLLYSYPSILSPYSSRTITSTGYVV